MSDRPDLVFILCDQLRADFLPSHGCRAIATPNIDRLAREGAVFENAVSPYPLCVPARAALLSGLNPFQSGVFSNGHWLRPDRAALGLRTWPDLLRDRGYRTASVGKMHFHPWDAAEGFDDRIIAEDKRWPLVADDYAEFLARHQKSKSDPIPTPEYQAGQGAITFPWDAGLAPDRFVGVEAAAYIRRQPAGRPMALMIGFPGPHCPYDPAPESLSRVDPSGLPGLRPRFDDGSPGRARFHREFLAGHRLPWCGLDYATFTDDAKRRIRHHYAASIVQIDAEVGRVLAALEATGRLDRSLIVFTSDHGDHVGDHDRVGKGTFYQPSVHVPLIVRRPGGTGAGRRFASPVQLQQVPATLLAAAEVPLPRWWNYRGLPRDPQADLENRESICGALDAGTMIRRGNWKLSRYAAGFTELFDLDSDPGESRDRSADPSCAELRQSLERELGDWIVSSAISGHADKRLPDDPPGYASSAYGRRGWVRPYPAPF